VQLELSKLFGSQLVRRLMEVRREVTNGADVVADRAWSEIAPLKFLQHALS
jgi:hypothetical protein